MPALMIEVWAVFWRYWDHICPRWTFLLDIIFLRIYRRTWEAWVPARMPLNRAPPPSNSSPGHNLPPSKVHEPSMSYSLPYTTHPPPDKRSSLSHTSLTSGEDGAHRFHTKLPFVPSHILPICILYRLDSAIIDQLATWSVVHGKGRRVGNFGALTQ